MGEGVWVSSLGPVCQKERTNYKLSSDLHIDTAVYFPLKEKNQTYKFHVEKNTQNQTHSLTSGYCAYSYASKMLVILKPNTDSKSTFSGPVSFPLIQNKTQQQQQKQQKPPREGKGSLHE